MTSKYTSLRRLVDLYDDLVDDQVGIIRTIEEVPRAPGEPDLFQFGGRACDTRVFRGITNFSHTGGASIDRDIAMAKAIGEAVERYSSALYNRDELPLYSYREAPFPCVPPGEFALHSPEQYDTPGFAWVPFTEDTLARWTPARDLTNGGVECYVPAAMTYIPYYFYLKSGEAPIVEPISTGMACHCSWAESVLSGAGEVIERDAFTITWQAQLGRTQIRPETLSDINYRIYERFIQTGCSVTILDLTMDHGIPVVLSVLRGAGLPGSNPLAVAASAHLNPDTAIRKSLEELAHTGRYAQLIHNVMPRLEPDPTHANVSNQRDHLNFWADPANTHMGDFLFTSSQRMDFQDMQNLETGDPVQDVAVLVERIRSVGHRVLVADLTTPDVGDLGLVVTRTLIPGFNPLFMGYQMRALGGHRLWEIPQKLGYAGITPATGDNPAPHPYP